MVATDETRITCLQCDDRPHYAEVKTYFDHLEERHPGLVTPMERGRKANLHYRDMAHVDYDSYAETTANWVNDEGTVYAHYCYREERTPEGAAFWKQK